MIFPGAPLPINSSLPDYAPPMASILTIVDINYGGIALVGYAREGGYYSSIIEGAYFGALSSEPLSQHTIDAILVQEYEGVALIHLVIQGAYSGSPTLMVDDVTFSLNGYDMITPEVTVFTYLKENFPMPPGSYAITLIEE